MRGCVMSIGVSAAISEAKSHVVRRTFCFSYLELISLNVLLVSFSIFAFFVYVGDAFVPRENTESCKVDYDYCLRLVREGRVLQCDLGDPGKGFEELFEARRLFVVSAWPELPSITMKNRCGI